MTARPGAGLVLGEREPSFPYALVSTTVISPARSLASDPAG
jgi:hypothetical protein